MSLKSFDKFCEDLILGKPGSQREIFDERQKIIQSRLACETLSIFGSVSFVNCLVMDLFFRWAEEYAPPMVLIITLCFAYWLIRNGAKGTLLGVGERHKWSRYTGIYIIFIGALNAVKYVFDIGEENFVIRDGMVTTDFLFLLSFLMMTVCGVIMLIIIRDGGEDIPDDTDKEK